MIEISKEQALDLLQEVVAEKGDGYVYTDEHPTCQYFLDEEEPGCIVGHVLAKLGMTRQDITDIPVAGSLIGVVGLNYGSVHSLKSYGVLKMDNSTFELLAAAQNRQDQGLTWGEALIAAKETAQ